MLDDFEHRKTATLSSEGIAETLTEKFQKEVPQALVNVFGAPPVEGLGTAGGIKIIVQDTGNNGLVALQRASDQVVANGEKDPKLARPPSRASALRVPRGWSWSSIASRRRIAASPSSDIRSQLESTLGSYYINDFNRFGRTWQVNVQAMGDFRQSVDDIKQIKSAAQPQHEVVPLADFASVKYVVSGPVLAGDALQHVPGRRHPCRRRAGYQLRPGDRRALRRRQ